MALILLSATALYALDEPGTVVYENKKGNVTFAHIEHMKYGQGVCTPCHESEGAPIDVDKKFGHEVCKDCHKRAGNMFPNAPVSCTGCHKK